MSATQALDVVPWSTAITVGTIIFTFGGFYWTTRIDMKAIKDELVMMRKAIQDIAVQNARLDNHGAMIASVQKQNGILEQRLYNLSVGKGWIKEEIRTTLDGEYP